jgi:hypothetical protein
MWGPVEYIALGQICIRTKTSEFGFSFDFLWISWYLLREPLEFRYQKCCTRRSRFNSLLASFCFLSKIYIKRTLNICCDALVLQVLTMEEYNFLQEYGVGDEDSMGWVSRTLASLLPRVLWPVPPPAPIFCHLTMPICTVFCTAPPSPPVIFVP